MKTRALQQAGVWGRMVIVNTALTLVVAACFVVSMVLWVVSLFKKP